MKTNHILEIKNLQVKVEDKLVISDLNFTINPGEIHVIMGPNGSGKSTLANTLARHPNYAVTNGQINFMGEEVGLNR